MKYNRKLKISSAGSRKATVWQTNEIMWSSFVDKLKTPLKSTETLEEYLKLSKPKQDALKDVGGFVGGSLKDGRRKAANVEGRDLVTLDLDNIPTGKTNDIIKRVDSLGCASCIYSTRKHAEYAPRVRVIIPLDVTVSADEYEPIARKLASLIGMEFCDPTTFEPSRLMYWPSTSSNGEYVYEIFDKAFCNAKGILDMYSDWKDISSWPQVRGVEILEKRRLAKQENPKNKRGVVGAFCRVYSITEAMDKYINGMYEETAEPGRYTFTGGTTAGGAIVYEDDTFLFSHHATDPTSGQLVNAFDLIRLHMFSELDKDAKEGTPNNKLPSYIEMSKMALSDKAVADLINTEKIQRAQNAFLDENVNSIGVDSDINAENNDFSFIERLSKDVNGRIEKTINNAVIVLENDKGLKGKIVVDEFASCGLVLGSLPWDKRDEKRRWTDSDDSNLYNYMELFYGISGRDKLDNALNIVTNKNRINDVRDYLQSLKWDGKPRLDTLLIDYLGAEDNPYVRAVMRKTMCAAVARAVISNPNDTVKFDYMPILIGGQGIGKSTLLSTLGKEWFSDSLTTFEGKDAAELIQGIWINEVGELTAMNKQETNAVKQFISKKDDIYRAAYGRRTCKYPRRGVFIGTSNEDEVLKDQTGNRRFWPVDVGENKASKSVWEDLPGEVDQLWAEAYAKWQFGEPLYLSKELEKIAEKHQEAHRVGSDLEGSIEVFLEKSVPENWDNLSITQRRAFLANPVVPDGVKLIKRDKVCAIEVWTELLNGDKKHLKRQNSIDINNALNNLHGWVKNKKAMRFGEHGVQKGYIRDVTNTSNF